MAVQIVLHPGAVAVAPAQRTSLWRRPSLSQRGDFTSRCTSLALASSASIASLAAASGRCALQRRQWPRRATAGDAKAQNFFQKLRSKLPKPPSKEEMQKYGTAMLFSYSFLGTLNMCAMVAISWPLFIMRTGGSPVLFSPLKLNPKYALYLTGLLPPGCFAIKQGIMTCVYFTFGSCATPFLLAASVGLAPLFAKLLSGLQNRLKCPKWLAFFLLGLLMAACYVAALPLLITLACVALRWRRHSAGRCETVLINDENVLRLGMSEDSDLDEVLTLTRSFDLISYVDATCPWLQWAVVVTQVTLVVPARTDPVRGRGDPCFTGDHRGSWRMLQAFQLQLHGFSEGQQLHGGRVDQAKAPGMHDMPVLMADMPRVLTSSSDRTDMIYV
eukprot:Skav232674  [mRNA]  locus=scaffold698:298930:304192:+ [translate_table: standard]